MYKLIATDMDGTLLNDAHQITDETYEALKAASEQGVKIVLSTGRPYAGLRQYKERLAGIVDYTVSYNGALIEDVRTGQLHKNHFLGYDDLVFLHELSETLNVGMHFVDEERVYTAKRQVNRATLADAFLNELELHVVDVDDRFRAHAFPKILFAGEPEELDRVTSELPSFVYEKFTVVRSADIFLEFIHLETNKGSALEQIVAMEGLSLQDSISFGDNENDMAMLRLAGLGVAMENATEKVKAAADRVTVTNEAGGVARAIEEYVLKLDQVK